MAAYFVPHPLESRMQLRIETMDGVEPTEVFIRTLDKVMNMCDEFTDKFNTSLADVK